MKQTFDIEVLGHCLITDDTGAVLLDQTNAVHPQNLARVFARGLSREDNYFIHRMAFGNGGTVIDAARTVTYRTPNDGQNPDTTQWRSRLYNETYSEIVDVLNPKFGTDPGSSDEYTGLRLGGGAISTGVPETRAAGAGVRSRELGLQSEVIITCVISSDEPVGQYDSDDQSPSASTESGFVFDEIGLYTAGLQALPTSGYQQIDVFNKTSEHDTGLTPGVQYKFDVSVDGNPSTVITFTPPLTGGSGIGGQILYGDLCQAINTSDAEWGLDGSGASALPSNAKMLVTDLTGGTFPSITNAQTHGYLVITSITAGSASAVDLTGPNTNTFMGQLNPYVVSGGSSSGAILVTPAVPGTNAGVQNDAVDSSRERERLLTHIIFSPVLKSKNRTLTVTYTLTITVDRTVY